MKCGLDINILKYFQLVKEGWLYKNVEKILKELNKTF